MLSFVDNRILLLLAVTSCLATCQCKFDYLLFFSLCDGYFFGSPLLEDLVLWLLFGTDTEVAVKTAQSAAA